MIEFLKKLLALLRNIFAPKNIVIDEAPEITVEVERRGVMIILPVSIWEELESKNYSISVVMYKGKPSSVQVLKTEDGKSKYVSTLKSYMNIKSFINGNPCDYRKENLIFNDK
jgi:hypothetical protein